MKKKITALLLSVILTMTCSMTALADSGYRKYTIKSSYGTTEFNCSMWWENNFWDTELHASGSASTVWAGTNPFNADSIVHSDILDCTGVGSMSVGISKSGPSVSTSVSGHTATFSYTAQNTFKINVDYDYYTTGLLAGWSQNMRTAATIQLGSNFYSFGT